MFERGHHIHVATVLSNLDGPELAKLGVLCGVATLTPLDMATIKLLANADRRADDAVLSRDVIDLAMMAPRPDLLRRAIDKAEEAYPDVQEQLRRAIDRLQARTGRLGECRRQLQMTVPAAVLWQNIKALRPPDR